MHETLDKEFRLKTIGKEILCPICKKQIANAIVGNLMRPRPKPALETDEAAVNAALVRYANNPTRKHWFDRNIEITVAVINGSTYKTAGGKFGITPERARQCVIKVLRLTRKIVPSQDDLLWPRERSINQIRKDRGHWLKRLELLETSLTKSQEREYDQAD